MGSCGKRANVNRIAAVEVGALDSPTDVRRDPVCRRQRNSGRVKGDRGAELFAGYAPGETRPVKRFSERLALLGER